MQNPQNPYQPPISSPTGEINSPFSNPGQMPPGANNSGMGAQSVLPDELRGLNGGAFFLNWIWAIAHSTWLGLLAFVPYIGFVVPFVLLFKGNEWAWQNRKWSSVEQFKATQRIWTIWGVGLTVLAIAFLVFLGVLGSTVGDTTPRPISSTGT